MAYLKFTELEVWKESRKLRKEIYDLTKKFPNEEKFRMVDQMIRSTRSICANLAEGHGRYHFQENIQFTRMARGSLTETLNHLTDALDCELITENTFELMKVQIDKIERIMNGYISYLKKQKSKSL
ncbi:MAG: four helix bundle protein [Bacteroidota bacterium]